MASGHLQARVQGLELCHGSRSEWIRLENQKVLQNARNSWARFSSSTDFGASVKFQEPCHVSKDTSNSFEGCQRSALPRGRASFQHGRNCQLGSGSKTGSRKARGSLHLAHSSRGQSWFEFEAGGGAAGGGPHEGETPEGEAAEEKPPEGNIPGGRTSAGEAPDGTRGGTNRGPRPKHKDQQQHQELQDVDALALLGRLRELGLGELSRPPRRVHFSGCINSSYAFFGSQSSFFVKVNRAFSAAEMFTGESLALRAMAATGTISVPRPLAVGDLRSSSSSSQASRNATAGGGSGSYLVMEHLRFRPFAMLADENQSALGSALARLHLAPCQHVWEMTGTDDVRDDVSIDVSRQPGGLQQAEEEAGRGDEGSLFGFPCQTRLGVVPLSNPPSSSWPVFFVNHRLKDRLLRASNLLGEEEGAKVSAITADLLSAAGSCLESSPSVKPSLLHGDLWIGNCGLCSESRRVTAFDPAAFIGHSEFDLAFKDWPPAPDFPGFSASFYDAYHAIIPKAPGFDERHEVYQLFHLLNHFLIYGWEYYPYVKKAMSKILKHPF